MKLTISLAFFLILGIPKEIVKRSFKVKQVLSVEYRLVHQSCFPAQIIDALSAYMYLIITLQIPSRNILLIGDSAGGSLTLSLCRYLRDEGFDLPRGTLLMSPWSDMTNDVLPKCSFYKPLNKNIDYLNSSAVSCVSLIHFHLSFLSFAFFLSIFRSDANNLLPTSASTLDHKSTFTKQSNFNYRFTLFISRFTHCTSY